MTATSDAYDGPAHLLTGHQDVEVEVRMRGFFQPIDGRYHWYGRISHGAAVDDLAETSSSVVVRTPHGDAAGRLSDRDPWGRFRVGGTGRPPFEADQQREPGSDPADKDQT